MKKTCLIFLLLTTFFSFSQGGEGNINFNITESYTKNNEVNLPTNVIDEKETIATPSINIFSPTEGHVFEATITVVDISYDILDFPSFTPGVDGSIYYRIKRTVC